MSASKSGKQQHIDTSRPPIVAVMGHVDHGKTSILDYIRKANVVAKEYGGITQHTGAYQVTHNSKKITFIDTPGHQAFYNMRARGGKAADIVILVVSAEEGVKPQTKEAITHAQAAGVPIIVAITKIDLPGADVQKIKKELSQNGVLVEDFGGDVLSVSVSAKTGAGVPELLNAILTVAELQNLKGTKGSELEAIIIEARSDKKRGVAVSAIIKNGSLKVGDKITASGFEAKVISLSDDKGVPIKDAGPSTPVEILGFKEVPRVGDTIVTHGSELAELSMTSESLEIIGKNAKKTLGLILKSDTQGTLEAIKASLAELVTSAIEITYALKFVHSSTGDITESDVALARGTGSLIMGFDVKASPEVLDYAEVNKVKVYTYRTIYELLDTAKEILEGKAVFEESKVKGRAQILKLFKLESGDVVLGSKVIAGALKEDARISIYDKLPSDIKEGDAPLYTGAIKKLKKGKEEVKVVGKDNECGVLLKPDFMGATPGLWIEVL